MSQGQLPSIPPGAAGVAPGGEQAVADRTGGQGHGTEILALHRQGEPVAQLTWRREAIWLGGRPVSGGSIRDWQVRADMDARRAAAELLAGCGGGALLVSRTGLPGFARSDGGLQLHFPPSELPASPLAAHVRPFMPGDEPALVGLAAGRHVGLAGPVWRQERDWSRFWRLAACEQLVVYEGPAGPQGYLRLAIRDDGPGPRIDVTEWLDDDPQAMAGLMGYLAALQGQGYAVATVSLPPDRPFVEAVRHVSKQAARRDMQWFLRPGPPQDFLPALAYGPGAGELSLSIVDPLGLWPDHLELAWQDGVLAGWRSRSGPAALQVTLPALVLIAFGQLSVPQAVYLGWLTGPEEDRARLAQVWRGQPFYRYAFDQG